MTIRAVDLDHGAIVVAYANIDPETEHVTYTPDGDRQIVFHRNISILGNGYPWLTADLPDERVLPHSVVQHALDNGGEVLREGREARS